MWLLSTPDDIHILTIAGARAGGLLWGGGEGGGGRRGGRCHWRGGGGGRRRLLMPGIAVVMVLLYPTTVARRRLWTGLPTTGFFPRVESFADRGVSQRGRGHAAQLVALGRQHGQGGPAHTAPFLQHKLIRTESSGYGVDIFYKIQYIFYSFWDIFSRAIFRFSFKEQIYIVDILTKNRLNKLF